MSTERIIGDIRAISSTAEDGPMVSDSAPDSSEQESVAVVNGDETLQILEFLDRLPPMERTELQTMVHAFASSICHGDSSVGMSPVEEAFWQSYNIRTCHSACEEKKKHAMYAKEIRHLSKQMTDYQQSRYQEKDGVTARFTITEGRFDSDGGALAKTIQNSEEDEAKDKVDIPCILLHTYVERLDRANGTAGSWQGCWQVHLPDETQAKITGHLHLHTHFDEAGNQIQSQVRRTYQTTVSTREEKVNSLVAQFEKSTLSYAEKVMTKVMQYITAQEDRLYQNLEHWFQESVADDGLRRLRRILPITKTRFKWDSSAQRNVQLLNARKAPAKS